MINILVAHRPWASVILTFEDFCISITQLYSDVTLKLVLEPNSLNIKSKPSNVEKKHTKDKCCGKKKLRTSAKSLLTHLNHCNRY
jgi:hypothetical protein